MSLSAGSWWLNGTARHAGAPPLSPSLLPTAAPCQVLPPPLTFGAVPQRLDLLDAVLQPLQPQPELQLLLPPVEAEGQVMVLGQSRAG